MAKLHSKPYPGEWDFKAGEDIDTWCKRTEALLNAIPETMRFPVADGYATYAVVSRSPLVLQHVPFGDAWRIPEAHIRGLRLKDVELTLKREHAFTSLFAMRGSAS